MNLTQMENAIASRKELSTFSTLDRIDELFKLRHREDVIISFKLKQLNLFDERYAGTDAQSADMRAQVVNQITEAKERRARVEREIEREIVEAAARLAAKQKNIDF